MYAIRSYYVNKNLNYLKGLISEENPIIGIEPSAILTYRDESIDLAVPELKETAKNISKNA